MPVFGQKPAVPSPTVNRNSESTSPPEIARGLYIGKMQAGAGGKGGHGNDSDIRGTRKPGQGGHGGKGGSTFIAPQNEKSRVKIDEAYGGSGGEGGGGTTAGDGGTGGQMMLQGEPEDILLSKYRLPGPEMTIQAFGRNYSLSDVMVKKLSDCGYDTAGSLRFATVKDLKEDGFKHGHVNQVRHALDVWSPKA